MRFFFFLNTAYHCLVNSSFGGHAQTYYYSKEGLEIQIKDFFFFLNSGTLSFFKLRDAHVRILKCLMSSMQEEDVSRACLGSWA